ncbi:HesA/MoeB/ThiF family protein [Klebsiella pneumoniae subsp. ozaenae]|uniref:HesA/MoeB/ThiF family protein n=1 Tax=Klebsiella pneumoniae subsp. ozaenae TaxID=574 RepID=A0A378AHP4_KLEPO|nr:HesA/MoeB/ThiF family protein [Klebsiella pneumoniae subsp. ozaenae]
MTPFTAASGRCHFVLRFYVCCNQRCLAPAFWRTARLYGEKALQCFADAHVCVVGIGGVGSWAAEALARTGIGAITLIDMDDVCVTNTNRQIHALSGNVGLAKAEVMAERIRLINPECRVTVVDDFVTPENVAEYLGVGFSYVIDAIDSVRPKAALIAWCRRYKVPLVTTGGAGGQIDPTQIQVADLAKTIQDPLAAKLARAAEKPVWGGEKQQR